MRFVNQVNLLPLIFSVTIVTVLFIFQSHQGFSLWDEGYLWYGTIQTTLGKTPILDFMAYDPGRYYWGATIMHLLGNDGIITLRISLMLIQLAGLYYGIYLIIRFSLKNTNILFLLITSIIFILWMFPRHKLFDISICILLLGILTKLIEKPTYRAFFIAGFIIGLSSFFGRNHGLYGLAACTLIILYFYLNKIKVDMKSITVLLGGILFGFSPLIFMSIAIDGFFISFIKSIEFIFEAKTTNFPLPVPWPWNAELQHNQTMLFINKIFVGSFFVLLLIYPIAGLIYIWKTKQTSPLFIASVFLSIPYAHYAFSRADISHLALGIFPCVIGMIALIGQSSKKVVLLGLLMISGISTYYVHPGWQCYSTNNCVELEVFEDTLYVDPITAKDAQNLKRLASELAPNKQPILITPLWPGSYAYLGRESPIWEIYALYPRSKQFELSEINKIIYANPQFVFIIDHPLDGQDKLRYKNTHPETYNYIINNYDEIPNGMENPAYKTYIKKKSKPE